MTVNLLLGGFKYTRAPMLCVCLSNTANYDRASRRFAATQCVVLSHFFLPLLNAMIEKLKINMIKR